MKEDKNKIKRIIRKNFVLHIFLVLIIFIICLIIANFLLYKFLFWFLENNIVLFLILYIYCLIMLNIKITKKFILKIINPYFMSYLKAIYTYLKYVKVTPLIKELEYQVSIISNKERKENYKLFLNILYIMKEGVNNDNLSKLEGIKYDLLSQKNKINYDFWLLIGYLEIGNLDSVSYIISKYENKNLKNNALKIELMKNLFCVYSGKDCEEASKYFLNLLENINHITYRMIINYYLANIYINENKYYDASIYLKDNISYESEFFIAEKSKVLFEKILDIKPNECYKKVVKLGKKVLNVELNYDEESFELLDKVINKISKENIKKNEREELSYIIGIYFGELLLKNGFYDNGVRWNFDINNQLILSNEQNFNFSPIQIINKKIDENKENGKSLKCLYNESLIELKNKKEKFSIKIKIDLHEYRKMSRHFYDKFNVIFIILSVINVLIGFYDLVPPDNLSVGEMLLTDIVLIILIYIFLNALYFIILPFKYKKYKNNVFAEGMYEIRFYNNYIEIISNLFYKKIDYKSIMKIKEYKNRIYIIIDKKCIIPIIKKDCTFEQISFIKQISDIKK